MEYEICVTHISYSRYYWTRTILRWIFIFFVFGPLAILYFYMLMSAGRDHYETSRWFHARTEAISVRVIEYYVEHWRTLGVFTGVMIFFPLAKIIVGIFYPNRMVITINSKEIRIGRKRYSRSEVGHVDFVINGSPLQQQDQDRLNRLKPYCYDLKFRRIDMLYGLRRIPITTMAGKERVSDFINTLMQSIINTRTKTVTVIVPISK